MPLFTAREAAQHRDRIARTAIARGVANPLVSEDENPAWALVIECLARHARGEEIPERLRPARLQGVSVPA